MSAPKVAMVMAAGLGTRMKPLTDDRPKALVEVGGKALIDHVLDRLADVGVERAVVNLHAFADRLEAHLKPRVQPRIEFSDERSQLLETGGGLKHARTLLGDDPIFVANIDSVWIEHGPPALGGLAAGWNPETMDARLLLTPTHEAMGFDGPGDFFLEPDGRLRHRGTAPSAPYAYIGMQVLKPQVIDGEAPGAFSLFPTWARLIAEGRAFGRVLQGQWMHVGDPEARDAADARLAQSR
ncbi:MAG: nucleotidyltransferase family protein [Caulobacteraceae bacterium]